MKNCENPKIEVDESARKIGLVIAISCLLVVASFYSLNVGNNVDTAVDRDNADNSKGSAVMEVPIAYAGSSYGDYTKINKVELVDNTGYKYTFNENNDNVKMALGTLISTFTVSVWIDDNYADTKEQAKDFTRITGFTWTEPDGDVVDPTSWSSVNAYVIDSGYQVDYVANYYTEVSSWLVNEDGTYTGYVDYDVYA